jgi:Type IV secretion system pilin
MSTKKIIKLSIVFLLLFNIFFIGLLGVRAAGLVPEPSGTPPAGCPAGSNCGNYQLNDFMKVAINVSNFILGIVGSLSLLAFIAGGLMWMLSAGNAEMVTRGKQTIIGAVIGLAIVFTSFMIIQLVYASLGLNWKGTTESPKPTTKINSTI